MNTNITARLNALEQRLKNDNEVYWVDLIDGFFLHRWAQLFPGSIRRMV